MPEPPQVAPDAPLIVTLGFDEGTSARLNTLRCRFCRPERNLIPAYLSLFHALPPCWRDAVAAALGAFSAAPPIPVRFAAVIPLGSGYALEAEAPGLPALPRPLAGAFAPRLTPRDRQPFRPHAPLMNKAERTAACLTLAASRGSFEPWAGTGESLLLWAYLGGQWDALARYPLSGPERSPSEI